jgi:ketosteroid isomerase-like protein
MSLDPVELVRANSAAFSALDVETMLTMYAPEAVVCDHRSPALLGEFAGHDQLRAFYEGITGAAAEMHERLDVIAAEGEVVVADCELRGRLKADPSGHEVAAPYGMLVTVRDGLITRLELHDDGSAALEASGLQPG